MPTVRPVDPEQRDRPPSPACHILIRAQELSLTNPRSIDDGNHRSNPLPQSRWRSSLLLLTLRQTGSALFPYPRRRTIRPSPSALLRWRSPRLRTQKRLAAARLPGQPMPSSHCCSSSAACCDCYHAAAQAVQESCRGLSPLSRRSHCPAWVGSDRAVRRDHVRTIGKIHILGAGQREGWYKPNMCSNISVVDKSNISVVDTAIWCNPPDLGRTTWSKNLGNRRQCMHQSRCRNPRQTELSCTEHGCEGKSSMKQTCAGPTEKRAKSTLHPVGSDVKRWPSEVPRSFSDQPILSCIFHTTLGKITRNHKNYLRRTRRLHLARHPDPRLNHSSTSSWRRSWRWWCPKTPPHKPPSQPVPPSLLQQRARPHQT